MYDISLTVDDKVFREKETSKTKAKIKICKKVIKHLKPNSKHNFF